MRLIPGGKFSPGDPVLVDGGKPATVVFADFETLVFRGEVSVVYPDGSRELVARERLSRCSRNMVVGTSATRYNCAQIT